MHVIHAGPTLERWNHIFQADGRSLIIALDHLPSGLLTGWEFPEITLTNVLAEAPDAIMTNFGILKHFSHLLSDGVGRILRVDGGPSFLLESWPDYTRWEGFFSVEDAINLGADAVIANLFIGGPAEVDCLRVAARVAGDCLRLGVPCAFEAIPAGISAQNGDSSEIIAFSCRMAAEFGADFIKTPYTGSVESFSYVTSRCPVPILIAGGPKMGGDDLLLRAVRGMLDAGGSGMFIGRNVWQHQNPSGILRALKRLIHENATIDAALRELQQN